MLVVMSSCPSIQLTAVEATGPVDRVIAVSDSAANAGAVAPHHLREVAPGSIKVWVVVGVLGLLLVPAVGSSAGELDPGIVAIRRGANRREVAAGAFLATSANVTVCCCAHTYMLGVMRALFDVCSGCIG